MQNSRYRLIKEEDLATSGTWLSACEQKSAKAERQIHAIKKARFMRKMIGESFDGLVSSVTKFGVFVLLREFNIDGLVRMEDLGGDRWEFNEELLTLSSKRSGFTYKMGDVVRVTVSQGDIEQGQVNFVIEGATSNVANKEANKKNENFSKKNRPQEKAFSTKKAHAAKTPNRSAEKIDSTKPSQPKKAPIENKDKTYVPKPRYASLADYLEKTKKGSENEEKSKPNSTSRTSQKQKNSQERSTPQNNSGGVRKARPQKSRRNNKSR